MKEKLRLVVVEDHRSMQLVLSNLLKDIYLISVVSDGLEALSVIKSSIPDIILLDLNLPNMDGLTFLKYIRKSILYKDIPVIVLTGDSETAIEKECKKLGASAVLTKPFVPNDLFSVLIQTNSSNTFT